MFQVSCVSPNAVMFPWRAHPYTNCLTFGAQHASSAATARKMPRVEMLNFKMHLGIFHCQSFLTDL